jgi:hypothetical protein
MGLQPPDHGRKRHPHQHQHDHRDHHPRVFRPCLGLDDQAADAALGADEFTDDDAGADLFAMLSGFQN